MYVWKDTTIRYGNAGQQLSQLFIVSDGKLDMPGDNSVLLIVTGSITGQLEDLDNQQKRISEAQNQSLQAW